MATIIRQVLARAAFFEQARQSSAYSVDALIPLVLPAISGKADTIFSAEELSKELAPSFGGDLVQNLADSMVEPLLRNGYLKRAVLAEEGAVYIYTDKANSIPVASSASAAERDLDAIMVAFADFIAVTKPIKPIPDSNDVLRDRFVDWITTGESSTFTEADARDGFNSADRQSTMESDSISDQLQLMFSSFVNWVARERTSVFEKVVNFSEIGLVIDFVSEIRVPTNKKGKVSLIVVLDTRIVLELLGLYGTASQTSILRLLQMCKEYGITFTTLVHLVDEVKETAYSTISNPDSVYPGSVNEAMRLHPEVNKILKRVYASPDSHIRSAGVRIDPYTLTHDRNALGYFTADDISRFIEILPYDKNKITMAKRDAWSLAYAVRRQNGAHTSNIY